MGYVISSNLYARNYFQQHKAYLYTQVTSRYSIQGVITWVYELKFKLITGLMMVSLLWQ